MNKIIRFLSGLTSLILITNIFAYSCPPIMPATNNIPAPFQALPVPLVNKGDALVQVKDQIYSLTQLQGKMLCVYTSSIDGRPEVGLITNSFNFVPDTTTDWTETKDIFTVYGCDPSKASCSFREIS